MNSVTLEPLAEADIDAAVVWYEGERQGLGVEFLLELDAVIERIAANPLGYERSFLVTRRALTRRFPYAVYFVCEGDEIRVFAVLHQHRAGAEWLSRLR